MENKVVLTLTVAERDRVVFALEALRDEYNHIADSVTSRYLGQGFSRDALTVARLSEQIAVAAVHMGKDEMNKMVRDLMDRGQKIDAIKLVRVHTLLGLKEAKDYVEALPNKA